MTQEVERTLLAVQRTQLAVETFDPTYEVSMGWRRITIATLWIISLAFLYLIS